MVYQNGQYVAVAPGATTAVAVPAAAPLARVYGRVTRHRGQRQREGAAPDGHAFEFRPPVGTVVRKGDPVVIDMTFGAPAPSALPR